jgi:hypothetical protein
MTTLAEKIASLEAKIASYEDERRASTDQAERKELLRLIRVKGETLNRLLEQQNAGKLHPVTFRHISPP